MGSKDLPGLPTTLRSQQRLDIRLVPVVRDGLHDLYDGRIMPSADYDAQIRRELREASVFVALAAQTTSNPSIPSSRNTVRPAVRRPEDHVRRRCDPPALRLEVRRMARYKSRGHTLGAHPSQRVERGRRREEHRCGTGCGRW